MLFPRKPGGLGSSRAASYYRRDGPHISQPTVILPLHALEG